MVDETPGAGRIAEDQQGIESQTLQWMPGHLRALAHQATQTRGIVDLEDLEGWHGPVAASGDLQRRRVLRPRDESLQAREGEFHESLGACLRKGVRNAEEQHRMQVGVDRRPSDRRAQRVEVHPQQSFDRLGGLERAQQIVVPPGPIDRVGDLANECLGEPSWVDLGERQRHLVLRVHVVEEH
ncbi:MAG: hypothetical protein KDA28_10855, partial [Phycisphaerales bacterium]|nr:hypothetical protein [Phycisphaerales bacterium]